VKPIDLDASPHVPTRWWILGNAVLTPILRGGKRMRVRGKHHVPANGPTLLVSNHVSYFDPPSIGLATSPRKSFYMAKRELFDIPVMRRIFWRTGAFAVERGEADRRAIRQAREVLRRGDVLLMFPEGTRNPEGIMRPGLPGAGSLALEPGVAVIPVAIWGSQRRFGPTRVVYGPRIDLSDLTEGPRSRRSLEAVERMMAGIAELVPKAGGPAQPSPGVRDPAAAPPEVVDG
jgi:1-acyl-sn-glycerol-3-phosphate acyltransferase